MVRQKPKEFCCMEISKDDLWRAMRHPLATGQSPFAAKAAQIVYKHPFRQFVWRDNSFLCDGGYFVFRGYVDKQGANFVAAGVGQIRGKWEPGLLLEGGWGPVRPAFEWKVSWPQGTRLEFRYALTDVAAAISSGFKLTIIAVESSGKEHILREETLKNGDKTVYDREWKLDYPVAKIRVVQDNIGEPWFVLLWFSPEVELPK
jgi:hypothetical protein